MDGNASSITGQLSAMETELYNILAEINIRKEKIDILKSKLSREEKNLADQLLNNINAQSRSLLTRNRITDKFEFTHRSFQEYFWAVPL